MRANYYFIEYYFKREVDYKIWRQYDRKVLVQADSFEEACEKIKNEPEHSVDEMYGFNDLTIR